MKPTPLERAILRTIAYFDLFDYPLTATEVWKWLYKPDVPPGERDVLTVARILEESKALGAIIERTEGFYHMRGRGSLVLERKWRNNRVDAQLRKAVRMVKWLRLFPPVKMIALASSITTGNVTEHSDIDVVIVARAGQIWQARLFTVGLLKLLGLRPDEKVTKDRFCLTFFVDEETLTVSTAAFGSDDIVYHYYIQSITPLYDPDTLYPAWLAANQWLGTVLPNATFPQTSLREVNRPAWLRWWHRFFDTILWPILKGPLKEWVTGIQMRMFPPTLRQLANLDSRVIISNTLLKFHVHDNRKHIRKRWVDAVTQYEQQLENE